MYSFTPYCFLLVISIVTSLLSPSPSWAKENPDNLILVQAETEDIDKLIEDTIELIQEALSLEQKIRDLRNESIILSHLASIHMSIGEPEKALEFYKKALAIKQEIKDRLGESNTFSKLADLELDQGNLNQALDYIEQSISIIESTRGKIISIDLKTSYFIAVNNTYQLGVEILMQLHQQNPSQRYNVEAFNLSERSRSRTFSELLTEAQVDIRQGIEPQLLQQEKSLQNQINRVNQTITQLYSQSLPAEESSKLVEPEEQKLISLTNEYEQLKDTIRRRNPEYAQLKFPQPLTFEQVQQQILDSETVLLQFSLGEKVSYLWLVTQRGIKSYVLPPRAEIEQLVTMFRIASRTIPPKPSNQPFNSGKKPNYELGEKAGTQLSEILFGQIKAELTKKRIVIVGDGALNYMSFASLPSVKQDGGYLINDYEIVNLPSSTSLATIRQFREEKTVSYNTVAIFADPVFNSNDERLKSLASESIQADNEPNLNQLALSTAIDNIEQTRNTDEQLLKRLPETRTEANNIQTYFSEKQNLSFIDFNANLKNIQQQDLSNYDILHLATHGIFNQEKPALSGLIFSRFDSQGNSINSYLRLNDVFNLNLANTELVVLSACETGLGQNVQGEGLIGLTRGFMYAGSPRVLVSLWQISDSGTAEMMKHFYRFMLEEKLTPAQALKQAQLEMQQSEDWSDPYYWAGFTLQGEWRK